MAVLAGQVHKGHVLAVAEGPVLVDPARAWKPDNGFATARRRAGRRRRRSKIARWGWCCARAINRCILSKQIGDAVNRRFHTFTPKAMKQGVATPKTDAFVELEVHPRYKYNLGRYLQVVRSVALFESPQQQLERSGTCWNDNCSIRSLAHKRRCGWKPLATTRKRALKKGLEATDPEVRFYAAEALAYLDETCSRSRAQASGPRRAGVPRLCVNGAVRLERCPRCRCPARICSTCPAPKPGTALSVPCGR